MEGELKGEILRSGSNDHPQGEHEIPIIVTTPTSGIKRTYNDAFEKQDLEHGDDVPSSHDTGESEDEDKAPSSIAESGSFMEAVLSNTIFLQTLTFQEIIIAKCVSRGWGYFLANDNTISKARRHDESRDWFFPTFNIVDRDTGSSRILQGMWHEDAEFSSTSKLCKLPPVDYLPPPTFQDAHDCICRAYRKKTEYALIASSGGLLLLQTVTALHSQKGSPIISNNHVFHCAISNNTWPALMVTNPLTQQFQVLPIYNDEPHTGTRQWWHYMPQFLMMVDEIANSYKVLFYRCSKVSQIHSQHLVVYDSMSMKWENVDLIHPPIHPHFGCWKEPFPLGETYATLCTRGRLYLADIRKPTATDSVIGHVGGGVVRLFQVEIGTGQLILLTEFRIQKSYIQGVQVPELGEYWQVHTSGMLRNLELVECMGHVYAVIPTRLDVFLYQPNTFRQNMWENVDTMSSTYMPLQFYIFQLEGDVGVEGHGVLRIRLPMTRKNCKYLGRRRSLVSKMWNSHDGAPRSNQNWFACTGRGSVIWVTLEDYLLQYNVLSGESTTEMLPTNAEIELPGQIQMKEKVGVAYRASFHMKP